MVYAMTEACDPWSAVLSFLLKDGTGRVLGAFDVIPGYPPPGSTHLGPSTIFSRALALLGHQASSFGYDPARLLNVNAFLLDVGMSEYFTF